MLFLGHYISVKAMAENEKDRIVLLSPLTTSTFSRRVTFRYSVTSSNVDTKFLVILYSKLRIPLYQLAVAETVSQDIIWAEVCIPSGSYYIGFVAELGSADSASDIALHSISNTEESCQVTYPI